MIFIVMNFFSMDFYSDLIAPLSALYAGILTIYVGTKEFDRWYDLHDGRHPGELFVIFWTALISSLFVVSFISGTHYHLASDIIADYILVLTVFALTQKSKKLHHHRKNIKHPNAR